MAIYDNVIAYCEKKKISIHAFEIKCEIGNGVVGRWKDGANNPRIETLMKIEKATKIPIKNWIS